MRDRGWAHAAMGVACAGALLLPAAASAHGTKTVSAGPPPAARGLAAKILGKAVVKGDSPDINAFFNRRTTIHVGDSVKFVLNGFHTVDLPGRSNSDLPLIVAGPPTVSGVKDAAGNPFWFDGKVPSIGLDPALLGRSKGHVYTGKVRLDSGLPLGPPKPFNVTFTKPGTYKFFCDVHPGMVGYITVRPKAAKIPTAKQDARTLLRTEIADIKALKKAAAAKQPTATVSVGESTSSGGELYTMFPSTLTVKPGTIVRFHMSPHSRETHTVTFGPASYLGALSQQFQGVSFPPAGVYPSDPSQPITLNPSSHGNGFANLGALDADPSTKQIPSSGTIDFTKPGVYHYICLIHPFMHGTIVVKGS